MGVFCFHGLDEGERGSMDRLDTIGLIGRIGASVSRTGGASGSVGSKSFSMRVLFFPISAFAACRIAGVER